MEFTAERKKVKISAFPPVIPIFFGGGEICLSAPRSYFEAPRAGEQGAAGVCSEEEPHGEIMSVCRCNTQPVNPQFAHAF